jgi:hypothetical protein
MNAGKLRQKYKYAYCRYIFSFVKEKFLRLRLMLCNIINVEIQSLMLCYGPQLHDKGAAHCR